MRALLVSPFGSCLLPPDLKLQHGPTVSSSLPTLISLERHDLRVKWQLTVFLSLLAAAYPIQMTQLVKLTTYSRHPFEHQLDLCLSMKGWMQKLLAEVAGAAQPVQWSPFVFEDAPQA